MSRRERVAQQLPPEVRDGFPHRQYDGALYRAAQREPWWFCTCGGCRFDLDAAHPSRLGTLYAGTDAITGLLETLGPEMTGRPVSRSFLAARTVWILGYDRALKLADLCADGAVGFGVTNELSSMVPYGVPQAWAQAFADDGWDGIAYRTRFSTGPAVTGVAAFDDAGSHDWLAIAYCSGDAPEMVHELAARNITVESAPMASSMDIIA